MTDRDLEGASIVVTGATGGLGREIARQLAVLGARLTLTARAQPPLEALGLDAAVVAADLRDSHAGATIVEAALAAHGRLDGLVNAAGIVAFGPLVETDDVVIEELFLTNVLGPLWLIRAAIPALTETRGFIANISAAVAEQPLPGMVAYAASKAALTAADRALTRELRRAGITVTDVRPPHTETGLAARPIAGGAPRLRPGLEPDAVARRIITAIRTGEREVPADGFAP
ncbi:MAG TPA: SDR family NAD(P)-dependent oxidoreductase [Acidimicrobiia bacterium]|nr:SDR family NAD(P)-dependent oxidoreductase [Acidimicrobiia bacterium]